MMGIFENVRKQADVSVRVWRRALIESMFQIDARKLRHDRSVRRVITRRSVLGQLHRPGLAITLESRQQQFDFECRVGGDRVSFFNH